MQLNKQNELLLYSRFFIGYWMKKEPDFYPAPLI